MHKAPLPLGVTLLPLGAAPSSLDAVVALGLEGVQLDAADPDLRPRELGESARRDLAAALRRRGLRASGIDCFIPVERFADPARVERAMDAVHGCVSLAEHLQRVPVCMHLPHVEAPEVVQALQREAQRRGVPLADCTVPVSADASMSVCVDPAAVLAGGGDPAAVVAAAGARIVAARVVDLLRSGLRGPVDEPGASRLDTLGYRVALEVAGFRGLPVIDCRQWTDMRRAVLDTAQRWAALLPSGATGVPS
jgi:sugar phosphate isomerase/epimerase